MLSINKSSFWIYHLVVLSLVGITIQRVMHRSTFASNIDKKIILSIVFDFL